MFQPVKLSGICRERLRVAHLEERNQLTIARGSLECSTSRTG